MSCPLCDRIQLALNKSYPYMIYEFKHSFLMLGEHQFFPGYSVLVAKNHYREMTDVPAPVNHELFDEMMQASKAIDQVFKPKKMNMCSLGNRVDHVHWHFFPRSESDTQFFDPPWLRMHLFDEAKISPEQALRTIEKLRQALALL